MKNLIKYMVLKDKAGVMIYLSYYQQIPKQCLSQYLLYPLCDIIASQGKYKISPTLSFKLY